MTSNRISQLNGKIEVAGEKAADVIVANPAGIICNGCGFINIGRGTLTTGTLAFDKDKLSGINVSGAGVITVTGQGLDDDKNKADYTALLARTVNVQAAVHAKDLQIMTGQNTNVIVENDQLTNTGDSGVNNYYATIGLDVSALGSMYADKITLIASQGNVGVNNKGLISADTALNISYNGDVRNDSIITTADLNLRANSLTNTQQLKATGTLNNNSGYIIGENDITVNAIATSNVAGLIAGNSIDIVSNTVANNNSSQYVAKNNIQHDTNVTGQDGIRGAESVSINAGDVLNTNLGIITAGSGDLSLFSTGNMVLDNANFVARDINISSLNLATTNNTKLLATNDINLSANIANGQFSATTFFSAGNDININAGNSTGNLYNYGTLSAAHDLNYNVGNTLLNYGTMAAMNNLNINSVSTYNYKFISGVNVALNSTNIVTNTPQGIISGMKSMSLKGNTVTNQGTITTMGNVDVYANVFNNTGFINSTVINHPY